MPQMAQENIASSIKSPNSSSEIEPSRRRDPVDPENSRRAKHLIDTLFANGAERSEIAQAAGYQSMQGLRSSIYRKSLSKQAYERLRNYAEDRLNSNRGAPVVAEPRVVPLFGAKVSAVAKAGPGPLDLPVAAAPPKGAKSIYAYFRHAREQLDAVVATYKRAIDEVSIAFTRPGLEKFIATVKRHQAELDEALGNE